MLLTERFRLPGTTDPRNDLSSSESCLPLVAKGYFLQFKPPLYFSGGDPYRILEFKNVATACHFMFPHHKSWSDIIGCTGFSEIWPEHHSRDRPASGAWLRRAGSLPGKVLALAGRHRRKSADSGMSWIVIAKLLGPKSHQPSKVKTVGVKARLQGLPPGTPCGRRRDGSPRGSPPDSWPLWIRALTQQRETNVADALTLVGRVSECIQ